MNTLFRRCLLCGKNIVFSGGYEDWDGGFICSAHDTKDIHVCHCCHRLCGNDAHDCGNDIWMCGKCFERRMTQPQARSLVNYIQKGFQLAGLGEIRGWTLNVVRLEKIMQVFGNPHVKGYAQRCGNKFTIYMLCNLSKLFFADVIAHEMLHIWQYQHRLSPPEDLCEGFCNLGSYYVLEHIGGPEAEELMRAMNANPDPVYGEGFRKIKAIYDKGGWKAAVEAIGGKL